MDAQLSAEIESYAERVTASWPAPSPAMAARLRALLNPPDLPQRPAQERAEVAAGPPESR